MIPSHLTLQGLANKPRSNRSPSLFFSQLQPTVVEWFKEASKKGVYKIIHKTLQATQSVNAEKESRSLTH